jgi:hypothetical protein
MRILLSAIFLVVLAAQNAQAGAYVEPDLGVQYGRSTQTLNGVASYSDRTTLTLGIKGGLNIDIYYAGLLYEQSYGGQVKDVGAFAGLLVQTFQAWAAYLFSAKDAISKGTGFELGAGLPIYKVAVNAAFTARKYNTYTAAAPSGTTYTGKRNTAELTLSLPIQL